MKKSLIALAALATVATAAQAQSSVTVYGVMDVGVATVNHANGNATGGNKTWTGMSTGSEATSRQRCQCECVGCWRQWRP